MLLPAHTGADARQQYRLFVLKPTVGSVRSGRTSPRFAWAECSPVSFGHQSAPNLQDARSTGERGHPVGAHAASHGGSGIAADSAAACRVLVSVSQGPIGARA
jgi:hypothetical protein